uniref:Uncharacterized protein n=1 Tax=viral metagenome TaxID=1070528 RepID=A0A2V0RLQ0_9ZZZZ
MLGMPEFEDIDPASAEDLAWTGRLRIGNPETARLARARIHERTGLNAMRLHSARTRLLLHTCSPLTVWFAENSSIVRHPETVPTYERHSTAGIRLACSKVYCIQTLCTDRSAAAVGVDGTTCTSGVGFPDLGQGRFGPAVIQAQVVASEETHQDSFNSKYSSSWSVSCDLQTRPPAASVLGSTRRKLDCETTCAGECPERLPPYVWSTFVGDSVVYLSPTDPPALDHSEPLDSYVEENDRMQLKHGHVVRIVGGSSKRAFFSVAPGDGPEDAANPPYLALTQQNQRLGPINRGAVRFGSYWAQHFDAKMRNEVAYANLGEYTRTMGTIPTMSRNRNYQLDTVVDLPLRRSAHGSHCLTNVCTPALIRSKVASSQPVPMGAATSAFSSIFR